MRTRPSCFAKLRQVPPQCSGVEQRLVRARSIAQLSHEACALSRFLGTVAAAQGVSYYSERSLCRRLSMEPITLPQARRALIQLGLIAYDPPLYQVLALTACPPSPVPQLPRMTASDTPMAIKDIFKPLAETLS